MRACGRVCRLALLLLFCLGAGWSAPPVYMLLWFDTEDYVYPPADDAALRIANDLTALGVRGTFKVVGEKARTLERRQRRDVIQALSRHDIGYHSNYHSRQPTPALYLNQLGWHDGVAEFLYREGPGDVDVQRIFGMRPSCYGQPGSSWGSQSYPGLRQMGIPVYLDEGVQVGLNGRPFWYGGLLHVFNMGPFALRASLEAKEPISQAQQRLDAAVAELEKRGGGLLSVYYHPTEFVTTEFWDAVNFSNGRQTEPADWKMPPARTREDAERCYGVLRDFASYALKRGIKFVTARDLPQLYAGPEPPRIQVQAVREHLARGITFLETPEGALSAADMLQILLGLEPVLVDGPSQRVESDPGGSLPRPAWERAKQDAIAHIHTHKSLPALVWVGSRRLSLADFMATLAADDGAGAQVTVRRGVLEFEKYVATDPQLAFRWTIHPSGFAPAHLLDLARLEAWTLKPARLR